MKIGTPEERAAGRRRRVTLAGCAVVGVALVAAAFAFPSTDAPGRGIDSLNEGIAAIGAVACFLAYAGISEDLSVARRTRRDFVRKYGLTGGGTDPFSPETYAAAAEALRAFRPSSRDVAERNCGTDAFAILVMTQSISTVPKGTAWKRMVSIRAIEEDRPADARDDAGE